MREVKFGLFSVTGDYAQALRTARRADTEGFYLNDSGYALEEGNSSPPQWRTKEPKRTNRNSRFFTIGTL
jgi:hypothetical protein